MRVMGTDMVHMGGTDHLVVRLVLFCSARQL